jgi:vitamin B12 transporter
MNTTIKLSLLTTLLLNTNLIAEEKLEDITVTSATKTSQNVSDVTSNINVITAQEIEERHYTTVTEALNSLPGVSFTSNGGAGTLTNVYLRGMSNNKTLVLIDGIRYNDITSTSGAPFAHLVASDIERIEVIKGAQSGIWGADASAGVINIITKKARKGLQFSVSQEFGSFSTTQSNINASFKNDMFYVKVNHHRLDTDGFTSYAARGTDINQYEDDAYTNKTTNIKAGFTITPSNKIDISHTIIDANGNYDDSNADNPFNNNSTNDKFSSINFNHIDSFNELNIYAKKSTFDRTFTSAFGTSPFKGEVKEYGLTSKIPYLSNSFLLVGGEYKKFTDENPTINNGYTSKALFLTNNNNLKSSLGTTVITESIRHDKYNKFDNSTTGKIGVKHTLQNGLNASINYGTAYNVPTPYNLYAPGSTYAGTFYPIGNANLQPEKTKSFDVTIDYKKFSATYFDTKVDNLIQYTNGFNNIKGTSKIKGYELAYSLSFMDDFLVTSSYTKLKTKDAKGFELQRRANELVKFGLDYYGVEDLHLGLFGEYVGDRVQYAYGTHNVNATTGKYTIANFTANYEVNPHLSFYGKVDNITDKYYQTVDGYATSPRAFYAGMKLTY